MKNYTQIELEEFRPDVSALEAIQFCLDRLYKDRNKGLEDEVVDGLTFEELIGALLMGRDLAADY